MAKSEGWKCPVWVSVPLALAAVVGAVGIILASVYRPDLPTDTADVPEAKVESLIVEEPAAEEPPKLPEEPAQEETPELPEDPVAEEEVKVPEEPAAPEESDAESDDEAEPVDEPVAEKGKRKDDTK